MLVPVLMSKLPEEMELIISRAFNSRQIWDISKILDEFKSKIQAQEKIGFVSGETESKVNLFESFSGSSFNIQGKSNNFNRYNSSSKQNPFQDGNQDRPKFNKNNFRTVEYSYGRNYDNYDNIEFVVSERHTSSYSQSKSDVTEQWKVSTNENTF